MHIASKQYTRLREEREEGGGRREEGQWRSAAAAANNQHHVSLEADAVMSAPPSPFFMERHTDGEDTVCEGSLLCLHDHRKKLPQKSLRSSSISLGTAFQTATVHAIDCWFLTLSCERDESMAVFLDR
ncbi:hypothetical protein MUK42_33559 [Musa troglodytarum]|uniref:Uncharacterized protein n=1 Tax=Musa troglodytarum TaxID=320322 RepID=A0A9E7FFH1_9LILI|nr:hypothetical protein MUK42_33559 [Musa troglodytarum]